MLTALVVFFVQNNADAAYNYGDVVACADINPDTKPIVSLKAEWEPENNGIFYRNLGDETINNNPSAYTIEDDDIYISEPIRIGYVFDGWCVGNNSEGCANPVKTYVIESGTYGAVYLYANWHYDTLNINYSCDFGENVVHSSNVEFQSPYTVYTNADVCYKQGYDFTDWSCRYDDIDGESHDVSFASGMVINKWDIPYNIYCVPDWKPFSYTVYFNANSNTVTNPNAMASEIHTFDERFDLPQNAFVNTGASFVGWCDDWNSTTNECDGNIYADEDSVSGLSSVDNGVVTLYALWATTPIICESGYYLPANSLVCEICEKGYYCEGNQNLGYNKNVIQGRKSCASEMLDSQATTQNVGSSSLSQCYKPCPNKENLFIDSEHNVVYGGSTIDESCVYKAIVRYNGKYNDCEDFEYNVYDDGIIPLCGNIDIVPNGNFIGWKNDNTNIVYNLADNPPMSELNPLNGIVNMTEVWEMPYYSVTYKCPNTEVGENNDIVVRGLAYGDQTLLLNSDQCNKPGYDITQWNCDTDNISNNIITIGSSDVVCEYQGSQKRYKIHYDGNGAESGEMTDTEDVPYYQQINLAQNQFTRSGYLFEGWCDSPVAINTSCAGITYVDNESVSGLTDENNASVTLYAMWGTGVYNINYVFPGYVYSYPDNPTSYTINSQDIVLQNPERKGYDFVAWCTDAEYTNCQDTMVIPSGSYGNKVFYAKMQPAVYNITYKYYDGTLKTIDNLTPSSYTYGTTTYLPTNVVVDGYGVESWCYDMACRNSTNGKISFESTGDMTFYAKLKSISCAVNQYWSGSACVVCPANSSSNGGVVSECDCNTGYVANGNGGCVLDEASQPVVAQNTIVYKGVVVPSYDVIPINSDGLVQTFVPGQTTYLTSSINVAGYDFGGWYYDSGLLNRISNNRFNNSGSAITVYAKLTAKTIDCDAGYYLPSGTDVCEVCIMDNHCEGGSFYYSDSETQGMEPCPNNYRYSDTGTSTIGSCYNVNCPIRPHYSLGYSRMYQDGTEICDYSPKSYNIYYELNGGSFPVIVVNPMTYTIETEPITSLPVPELADKVFDGWYDANDNLVTSIDTTIGGDITLYAHWKNRPCDLTQYVYDGVCVNCPTHSHTVTGYESECVCDFGYRSGDNGCEAVRYNIVYSGLNGATNNENNPTTYTIEDYGLRIEKPDDLFGYNFIKWTLNDVEFDEIPNGLIGNIVLVANWQRKSVTCESGYYLPAGSNTCELCAEGFYCTGIIATPDDTENKGLTPCDDGYTSAVGAEAVAQCFMDCELDSGAISVTGHVFADNTNNCVWRYPITFHTNGGFFTLNTVVPEYFDYRATAISLPIPTKSHYVFDGWYFNDGFEGQKLTNSFDCLSIKGPVNLYAKWKFVCESDIWLRVGADKICLYENKPNSSSLAIRYKNKNYYVLLSTDQNKKINGVSAVKMHVDYGNTRYNAYDLSAE